MRVAAAVATLVAGLAMPLASQEPALPYNPGSACFEVVVDSDDVVEFEGGIEFILAPSASPSARQRDLQLWDLRGPPRSEGVALWWPQGTDSIAAVWLREEGVLWELALDPVPDVMRGTAEQVLPEPPIPNTFQVRATQTACPQSR